MIDLHVPLFRAHVLVRVVLLLLAIVINLLRLDEAARPVLLLLSCVVMIVVTVGAGYMYIAERRRHTWVFVADVAITVVLVLASPYVLGSDPGGTSIGSMVPYWAGAAPLAVALWRGWLPSALVALAVAAADLVVAPVIDPRAISEQVVMLLACLSVGYFTSQLRVTSHEREQMYAVAAGMAERQRLARIVHDGVLQVLAMVEREGRALGPRGMRLARAAHQQEGQLRALLQDTDIDVAEADTLDATHANLAVILDRHAMHGVTISTPAGNVLVEASRAHEIDAAIAEALSNVAKHAGPEAQAWVLLERDDDELIISIRDNGVGGTPADFEAAGERGRMGMRHSIHGRLADLGGTATLRTAPGQGTEWEFRIPVGT
ncbi:MacS family sensor histidine kinase [Microlunatus sp. Y2014]|uniref:MacS family sensor histidine kinase n=1 Tax=Microlunatus sp. Y2014 TaxID=3418488 RepID=UPI003DA75688